MTPSNHDKTKIGVLGSGTMGAGIAQLAASRGHAVALYDVDAKALQRARDAMQSTFNKLIEKGKLSRGDADATLARIDYVNALEKLAGCGCVIEAVIEDLQVKADCFRKLEAIVAADCILATNTSSLSVAAIAAACKTPQRVVGAHFFNPAPLMPLVEIIPGVATSEACVKHTRDLINSWGKTTVLAKDTPGFIVNRVARPFYGEALRLLDEGIADAATIDAAMKELGGFKMGPFELMDFIGNDINYKVTESIFAGFFYDPRFKPSFTQKRLVEAGRLGKKSGHGFYDYREGAAAPAPDKNPKLAETIFMRILCMLINEAADALFLKVATAVDIDLAMTKGVNYPKGLLQWCDELGAERVLKQLETLHAWYGEDRYRPNPLLRELARDRRKFHAA